MVVFIYMTYGFSHTKTSYLLVVQSVFISRGDGGVNLNLGGHTFSGVVTKLSLGSLSEAVKAAFNASGSWFGSSCVLVLFGLRPTGQLRGRML